MSNTSSSKKRKNNKAKKRSSRPRSGRKRGAQPGNTNRLLHGAYARHISVEIGDDIDSMSQDHNQDELALARSRLIACLERQKSAPANQWIIYERANAQYLAAISRITHQNAVLGKNSKASLVTVLEMIRQVNGRQHVS